MEHQQNSLINTEKIVSDEHTFSLKTDCTNKFSISKLSENSPFQFFNSTNDDRNNYQVTFTFIGNQGNSLKNTVLMKFDELTFILIKS